MEIKYWIELRKVPNDSQIALDAHEIQLKEVYKPQIF